MNNRIVSRLARLEAMQPDSLIIICKLPTGEETAMSVGQCISAGADFLRVQSGNNLKDVGELLNYVTGPNCAIN